MRSRARMGKWNWHCGQTLRFSSSSLLKIIVPQRLHLVQRFSGMSRLRDLLPLILGFLTKEVSGVDCGGGVTAGSTVSNPSVFLVKVVVPISGKCCFAA